MIQARDRDFYSVAEAAKQLAVGRSTIWRWIEAGKLPAYRVGPKNIRIKRQDLEKVIQPARANRSEVGAMSQTTSIYTTLQIPPLTEEERERGLQALEELKALRREMLQRRGGKPFPSSVELIREMREERSRHLDQL
jgi:excisionase family DNA binding protein